MDTKTFYIKTFGCQMNEYDSSKMRDVLHAVGMTATENCDSADLIIFNTCSIREKAEEKLFSELGALRKFKEKKINLKIAVGGCVASQEGSKILQRAPFVDIIFGPQTLHRLPFMLGKLVTLPGGKIVDVSFPELEKFDYLPNPGRQGVSAFVSIMEGCNKFCSYCIVPYTRGKEVHRPFDDIINEVFMLAQNGVREVTLLGQNVNAYIDKNYNTNSNIQSLEHHNNHSEHADLAFLIQHIAEIPGIERIRFTTSHPGEFSDNLIRAYAMVPKLANHLHLPLQSGSDRILALMKRGHTVLEYKAKIKALRAVRPEISLTSDFIVGFPNESAHDFAATLQVVKDLGFDHSFSFIYSQRPGTTAASYQDSVELNVKKQRLAQLQELIQGQGYDISLKMLSTIQQVLITGISKKSDMLSEQELKNSEQAYKNSEQDHKNDLLIGRTENNRVVNVYAPRELIGQIIPVKITEVFRTSLKGEIYDSATNV